MPVCDAGLPITTAQCGRDKGRGAEAPGLPAAVRLHKREHSAEGKGPSMVGSAAEDGCVWAARENVLGLEAQMSLAL